MNTNKRKYIKWFIISEFAFVASLVFMLLSNSISNFAMVIMIGSATIAFVAIYKLSKLDEYKRTEEIVEEEK